MRAVLALLALRVAASLDGREPRRLGGSRRLSIGPQPSRTAGDKDLGAGEEGAWAALLLAVLLLLVVDCCLLACCTGQRCAGPDAGEEFTAGPVSTCLRYLLLAATGLAALVGYGLAGPRGLATPLVLGLGGLLVLALCPLDTQPVGGDDKHTAAGPAESPRMASPRAQVAPVARPPAVPGYAKPTLPYGAAPAREPACARGKGCHDDLGACEPGTPSTMSPRTSEPSSEPSPEPSPEPSLAAPIEPGPAPPKAGVPEAWPAPELRGWFVIGADPGQTWLAAAKKRWLGVGEDRWCVFDERDLEIRHWPSDDASGPPAVLPVHLAKATWNRFALVLLEGSKRVELQAACVAQAELWAQRIRDAQREVPLGA